MKILLLSATPFEVAPLRTWLEARFIKKTADVYENGSITLQMAITGVGMTATAFQLGWLLSREKPDWVINAGIAGAYPQDLPIGTVVQVTEERFGDLGVEEADGSFTDITEMGLWPHGVLQNPHPPLPSLPECKGLTVNKVHGSDQSITQILHKYPDIQVESMEGAAFFYACLAAGVPFVEIRSISNQVEPRNREAWNLPLAIQQLNQLLIELLEAIPQ
ncbi:MAG TPA: futalosine hydrolase [Saprospiraceae bacterium]|nr:futalosine hydrolase [Saprospiraceae bacterium]